METPSHGHSENTSDTPLLPDGQVDLNALRDRWTSGESEVLARPLREVFQEVGSHAMHMCNPNAHPDEEQGPRFTQAGMDKIRARAAQMAEHQDPETPA